MSTAINPLISVIVPVYNVELYIDACLNSIKQQTYKNLEIIVIEDCSTDSSKLALKPHLKDERIKIIQHTTNSGLSVARNTGIEAAAGDYIMFVDSDDVLDSNLIQACFEGALESAADVVLLSMKIFQDGEPLQIVPELKYRANVYSFVDEIEYFRYEKFAWLKFMRADLIRNKCLRFPIGQYYEDWPFHWETGFVASKIILISDGYYHYRQRGDSITGSVDKKMLHILSSQRLVLNVIIKHSNSLQINKAFNESVYDNVWFLLTNIDSEYLKEAVSEAKKHIQSTRDFCKYISPSLKVRILLLSLKLPVRLATIAVFGVRTGLNKLSTARRQIRG